MAEPKILAWDIETLPNVVTAWALNDQFINYTDILRERQICCAGWKWLGKDKVHMISLRTATEEEIVKAVHAALSSADILVAHNGDKFDLRVFNARAIVYGLPPIPPILKVDTLKVARRYFKFNSNRLDYLGQHLGLGEKLETPKGLWKTILLGIMDAELHKKELSALTKRSLRSMEKYNTQDVNLLESVYLALRGYIQGHPNHGMFKAAGHVCPNCGSTNVISQGYRVTRTGKYRRVKCNDCGAWSSEGKSEQGVELR